LAADATKMALDAQAETIAVRAARARGHPPCNGGANKPCERKSEWMRLLTPSS
jgi:hypothetical protein